MQNQVGIPAHWHLSTLSLGEKIPEDKMGVKSCFALNSKSLMNLAFMVMVEGVSAVLKE
jgi:hypothetical protein